MAKFVVLLLLLAYTHLSEQGECTGDDASYSYFGLTCGDTLVDEGQATFCNNPHIFKDSCCTTWAASCFGQCLWNVKDAYKGMTCGETLKDWGKSTFCSNSNIFIKDKCCKMYPLTCNGKCSKDESVAYQGMTCGETLKDWGQFKFCNNAHMLKEKCCEMWPLTCNAKTGFWDCEKVDGEDYNTIQTSQACDGNNDCANGEDETNCNTDKLTGDYVVELLVVVDPKAQAPYLLENNNNNKAEADKSILADIDYFLTEVNKLYHNFYKSEFKMRVSKLKVILLEKDFLEDNVVGGKFVDKDVSLAKFNTYLADTSAKNTFNYDHALFFSGYDFGVPGDSGVVGYAPMGEVCKNERAVSIVEYDGTYGLVSTVAHEIGHNLGAEHDPSAAPFIMAPDTENEDERWTFSGKSTKNIKKTIAMLDKVDNNCLLKTASPSGAYDIFSSDVTSALADPNVVCGRAVGKGAYYEPRTQSWSATGKPGLPSGDKLCNKITCAKGESLHNAYSSDGWPCGKQKACYEGKCVVSTSDAAAAVTDDTCVFGDLSLTNDLTCEQHLKKLGNTDFCHDSNSDGLPRGCCATYARICTKGKCTFGDMINLPGTGGRDCPASLAEWGKEDFCSEGSESYFKDQCCESYPKLCGDQATKRTLIDLLVDRLETFVARQTGKGKRQKLEPVEPTPVEPTRQDAPVAKGLVNAANKEPVFQDPVVQHVKRDDIAPALRSEKRNKEPVFPDPVVQHVKRDDIAPALRSEKRTLVDRLMEKLEKMEKKTLSDQENKEPVFQDPVVQHVKRDDIAPALRSEKRTLVDRLMEKLEEMETHEARAA